MSFYGKSDRLQPLILQGCVDLKDTTETRYLYRLFQNDFATAILRIVDTNSTLLGMIETHVI